MNIGNQGGESGKQGGEIGIPLWGIGVTKKASDFYNQMPLIKKIFFCLDRLPIGILSYKKYHVDIRAIAIKCQKHFWT